AFLKMAAAARADGVKIIPISGFRAVKYQKYLFEKAGRRYGSEEKAARWVAPPGFSEHHTGWSLDLGDETSANTDVDQSFEETKAFRWLSEHASDYGFEISFPKGNPQNVNYEPWHWRFIGNAEAKELFHP
ncbi:MAG: D-alanyl-D-alanine carboxypeptidase family protein, partial [Elusimicrobia bacterium]|nr:D-alanyl-D-alanine carboxypeptidase family protein [Elusimicrobiota bacterium]